MVPMMGSVTASDGSAELLVPAGEIEIEARKDKLRAKVSVNVPAGGSVPVEIALSEAP